MKQNTNIKKFIVLLAGALAICGMVYLVYVLFCGKKYTFYMDRDMGDIQAVSLSPGDDMAETYPGGEYVIYDSGVLGAFEELLGEIRMKPYLSAEDPDEDGFSIELLGEKKRLYLNVTEGEEEYFLYVTAEDENGNLTGGMKSWIERVYISREDGEKLETLVMQSLESHVRDITLEEIRTYAAEQTCDCKRFLQYSYETAEDAGVRTREMTDSYGETYKIEANNVIRLPIEGEKGYLTVWYYQGIYEDVDGRTMYEDVWDAAVTREDGETMSVYEDGFDAFLEEME